MIARHHLVFFVSTLISPLLFHTLMSVSVVQVRVEPGSSFYVGVSLARQEACMEAFRLSELNQVCIVLLDDGLVAPLHILQILSIEPRVEMHEIALALQVNGLIHALVPILVIPSQGQVDSLIVTRRLFI